MAWGETFTALQEGTIDGIEMPIAFVLYGNLYEVTKYLSLTNHIYNVVALTVSKRAFDRLPADLREMVVKAGAKQPARSAIKVPRSLLAPERNLLRRV